MFNESLRRFLVRSAAKVRKSYRFQKILEKPTSKSSKIIPAHKPSLGTISPAPVLLLEQGRLYESYGTICWGRRAFPGAGAPGRAAKIQESVNLLYTNPKICPISQFQEKSKFHENVDFRGHARDLSLRKDFSRTIKSTQRMHSWIARDLS